MGNKSDHGKKNDDRENKDDQPLIAQGQLVVPDGFNRDEILRAIRESKESYAFVVEKHRSNWIYKPMYQRGYVTGYKLVALMQHRHTPELIMHSIGLLEIRVSGKIYSSTPGGSLISHVDAIRRTDKLCTDVCMPVALQIMGPPDHVEQLTHQMECGGLEMVSQFNSAFTYKLGAEIYEPKLGERGQGCIQGIHFFINKSEAIKYLKIGFAGINLFGCTISKAVEDVRERKIIPKSCGEEKFIQMPDGVYYVKQTMYQPDSSDQCCICLEGIWEKDVCLSRCEHLFHKFCLSKEILLRNICPLCRGALV